MWTKEYRIYFDKKLMQGYILDKHFYGLGCAKKHKKLIENMREEVVRKVTSIREKLENVCLFDDHDVVKGQERCDGRRNS